MLPFPGDSSGAERAAGMARVGTVLRTTGLVIAGLLGAVAAWLIVTGDTQKDSRLGVVIGGWSLLLAAISVWGARRHEVGEVGGELMIRSMTGLDRLSDAAAVRDYEQRLQALIRNEIHQTLGPELASLRSEVAALRSELVEKVGGQMRLERIETTRLIGSDLEALQQEVQQLKIARQERMEEFTRTSQAMLAAASVRPEPTVWVDDPIVDVVEAVTVTPTAPEPTVHSEPPAPMEPPAAAAPTAPPAPPVPFVPPVPAEPPPPVEPPPPAASPPPAEALPAWVWEPPAEPEREAEPVAEPEREAEPAWIWQPEPEPEPVAPAAWTAVSESAEAPLPPPPPPAPAPAMPVAEAEPAPAPTAPAAEPAAAPAGFTPADDPFASLPRIRPFTEFDLDPIEPYEPPPANDYAGRRRSGGEPPATRTETDEGPQPTPGGRRRRATDDDGGGDDLLSQILERERN
ncbi:MAG TPA: DUF6779 domain-containing protein [Jatrophihabitantaceae bacterium]|nr:DUF6779 domain-containing protein [Jatrophihabitantaceae bacterium]